MKTSIIEEITKELSNKFNFEYNEAIEYLLNKSSSSLSLSSVKCDNNDNDNLSKTEDKHENINTHYTRLPKSNIILPFYGYIHETLCKGIKYNRGLNNQCSKRRLNGCDYCVTCNKNAMNNENKIPTSGDIRKRKELKDYLDYVTPDGKKSITYGTYLKIMKYDIKQVKQECKDLNIDIPEYLWEEKIKPRGRPKIEKPLYEKTILEEMNSHINDICNE